MTRDPKFITHLVLGPNTSGGTVIKSRHGSEEAAQRALRLAKGAAGFRIQTLQEWFA